MAAHTVLRSRNKQIYKVDIKGNNSERRKKTFINVLFYVGLGLMNE